MKGARIMREIQIQNFRSLKDTSIQKLSPITLLVGENSSGKSTFLRAFPLLKQSINKRTSGPILWAGDADDYVDFGSFEETVTNDGSDTIKFRFKFNIHGLGFSRGYLALERFMDSEDSASDSGNEIDYEITIASVRGREFVSTFNLSINSVNVHFDLIKNNIFFDDKPFYSDGKRRSKTDISNQNISARCGYIFAASKAFGFVLPNIDKLFEELMGYLNSEKKDEYRTYRLTDSIVEIGHSLSKKQELLLIDDSPSSTPNYPTWFVRDHNRITTLLHSSENDRLSKIIELVYMYRVFAEIDDYRSEYFKQVHYIAPLRATAERYYRLRNLAVDEVDYQGKNLAIFINSLSHKQLNEFHDWTNKHFGFTVSTDKSKGHLSLRIKLRNLDKAINLSDTGFGYSQVLPIITQLWELSSQKRPKVVTSYYGSKPTQPLVIAIEQPELHLHPAVQAKLAKAFIAAINLARSNGYELQLLLETHSQTIVDYLGRAIAKGILSQDDVTVVLFEKYDSESITTVKNSYYDSDGYLNDWPYGFFDTEE